MIVSAHCLLLSGENHNEMCIKLANYIQQCSWCLRATQGVALMLELKAPTDVVIK